MPRRRGGRGRRSTGGGLFGSKPAPQKRKVHSAPAPTRTAQSRPPAVQQQQGGSFMGQMGSMVASGMAFGAGSEIAHQGVRAMMGSGGSSHESSEAPQESAQSSLPSEDYGMSSMSGGNVCGVKQQQLYDCLNQNNGDAGACQWYFDALKQCQQQSSSFQ